MIVRLTGSFNSNKDTTSLCAAASHVVGARSASYSQCMHMNEMQEHVHRHCSNQHDDVLIKANRVLIVATD